jgi:hypothetical protein
LVVESYSLPVPKGERRAHPDIDKQEAIGRQTEWKEIEVIRE